MTYGYKVVKVEINDTDRWKKYFSKEFNQRYFVIGIYAIIKLGIPKKANIVTPIQMIANFTKSRCDIAKFVKIEKIYFEVIKKTDFARFGRRDIYYCDVTKFMKNNYDLKTPDKDVVYVSTYSRYFYYRFNKYVTPIRMFDFNQFKSCSSGIHYVDSFEEAKTYLEIYELNSDYNNVKEVKTDGIFS